MSAVAATEGADVFKLLRVPLLAALLLALGPLLPRYTREVMRIDPVAALGPWLLLVLIGAVFIAVAMTRRDTHHPTWLLVVEVVVATVLVLVPPIVWFVVFGRGLFSQAMGSTTGSVFAQALALAWLVAVLRGWRAQRRRESHD